MQTSDPNVTGPHVTIDSVRRRAVPRRVQPMTKVLSRNSRYLMGIGGLAIVAVVLVGLAYGATETERADIAADSAHLSDLRALSNAFTEAIADQESAIHDDLLVPSDAAVGRYRASVEAEAQAAAAFRAGAAELPGLEPAIDRVADIARNWRDTFAEPAIRLARTGTPAEIREFVGADAHDDEAIHIASAPMGAILAKADAELRTRTEQLATARTLATAFGLVVMLLAAGLALWLIRRYGRAVERDASQASVMNRFTEVTSFALDDSAIAKSNLEALALLTGPDAGVTHVLNRSKDRAVPEASLGDAPVEVLPLGSLSHCAGLARGSMYVTNDAAAPLSVHCPVYPVESGTLACVPLISGETVGAVHLHWDRPNALPLDLRATVTRIAEHAALAIGNRRLLAALQGQANTDPRTGLLNSRAFDRALGEALEARKSDESISVLMLDLDHFKDFNDRFGHPGGDEALRTFGNVLRSCMRDGDVAARYGGEEFAVLLPGVDADTARAIAERIRERTESTVVSLAPGQTARMTVSIGIATAPQAGLDWVTVLRIADDALYQSKTAGRNRVTAVGPSPAPLAVPSGPSRQRRKTA